MAKKVSATLRIKNVNKDILDTIIEMLEEAKDCRVKVVEEFDSPADFPQPR